MRGTAGAVVHARAFSGPRLLQRGGDPLVFRFSLLLTPVKPLSVQRLLGPAMRRWHVKGQDWTPKVAEDLPAGVGAVTVHHGTQVNPYINYPFLVPTPQRLRAYSQSLAESGIRLSIYYTLRELSNHAGEMPLLGSLGNQVHVIPKTG